MLETFDTWVRELGQLGYFVLAAAALIEYLAPPFPGDTVVLMGGAYAVRGNNSLFLVWVAVNLASAVGICANYAVGRYVALRVKHRPEGVLLFGVTHARVRELQEKMREKGAWLLVINRFLPSFRTVLFIAAGASVMPLRKVLLLGTISAGLWNALLLGVGYLVGDNAEALQRLLTEYKRGAFVVVGVISLVLLVRWWLGRRPKEAQSR